MLSGVQLVSAVKGPIVKEHDSSVGMEIPSTVSIEETPEIPNLLLFKR